MGTKLKPEKFDCYTNAEPDEPMFVLLSRDPMAPILVRLWADLREHAAGNPSKVFEARTCAIDMEKWRLRKQARAAADGAGTAPPDDPNRCALCGWPLAATTNEGCVRGNCSQRPLPDRFYAPERARAEYAPYFDNDPRATRSPRAHGSEAR